MDLKAFYAAVGGDHAAVLSRLPGEALVHRFLHKLPADPAYNELKAALTAEDIPTAFRAAHTIKGTAANLGLDTLAAASALTEALRDASAMPPQELVDAVDAAYRTAVNQIERLDG